MEAVCEKCARRDSAHDCGAACAATAVLTAAAKIANDAGFSLDETLEVVTSAFYEVWDLPDSPVPHWAAADSFAEDTRFVPAQRGSTKG
jgi:hypothetical protein